MSSEFDVVIAGDIFCDLIFTGLARMPELGEELYSTDFDIVPGGVYITAATLHRLGLRVGLFSHLGTDLFSRFVLETMEAEGLDRSLLQVADHSVRTITAAMSFPHDRSFVSFSDPRPLSPTPVEALSNCNFRHLHVHWLGQLWQEPELVEVARSRKASISLDSQCCPDMMARPDLVEKVSVVDVFMPNRTEARQITGHADPEEALDRLAEWVPVAIVKLGADGAIASVRGQRYRTGPLPIDAIDSTGAGDAFAGGLVYGMLSGLPFEESLRAAAICGGLSATARGGATNVPRLPELLDWMARDWK